jgi:hypothetical protein
MAAKEIKVKVGRKLTAEESKKVGKGNTNVMVSRVPGAEVEAQDPYYGRVWCFCGASGFAWMDTDVYVNIWCGDCGSYFRA